MRVMAWKAGRISISWHGKGYEVNEGWVISSDVRRRLVKRIGLIVEIEFASNLPNNVDIYSVSLLYETRGKFKDT